MANTYTVGWICAVVIEYVAARALLDKIHDGPHTRAPNDDNAYTLGEIGNHKVVIAVLPDGEYGTSSAASVAKDMLRTFTNIRIALMVGIGGGAPSAANDIRLGDIVVSSPRNQKGGVIQYDFGKAIQGQGFCRTGFLNQPPTLVRAAVTALRAEYISDGHGLQDVIGSVLEKKPRLRKSYARPDPTSDVLYGPAYLHHDGTCCTADDANDESKVIVRRPREEDDDTLVIHYGLIASGNTLMKDASIRDQIAAETGVLCFEMEAAGLMNQYPFLVIRGICDYSDTHKNKSWQGYAAMAAAAYAKALLCRIAASEVDDEERISAMVLEYISRAEKNIQKLTATAHRKEVEDILEWLTPMNYGPLQSDIIKLRQPGTGQWFLDTEEYRIWASGNGRTLYCPGMPGAGKTMIASIVVDDILRVHRDDPTLGIAFIFCNFQRNEQQTTEMLLCSLLKQLVGLLPTPPQQLDDLYDTHRKLRTRPSVPELSKLVQIVLGSFSRAFVIVDALDECQNSDASRDRFLNAFFDMQASTGVNIFLTSRTIPEIENMLREERGALKLEIVAEQDDMKKYIRGRMSELPEFIRNDLTLRQEIIMGISSSAKGMFLLAKLQLDSLKETTSIREVRSSIERTSSKELGVYNSAYEDALQRIENQSPQKSDLAKRVVLWITHSLRQLSETELRYALSVRPGSLSFDNDDLVQIDFISICAGLVVVDVNSSVIRLVHPTAHGFFKRTVASHFSQGHNILADACITYLSYEDFEDGLPPDNASYQTWLQSNPLYMYAATAWGSHVLLLKNQTRETLSSTEERALRFLRNRKLVESAGHTLMIHAYSRPDDYTQLINAPKRPNAFHIVGYFGVEKLLSELSKHYTTQKINADGEAGIKPGLVHRPQPLEVIDQLGRTPLFWASIENREGAMRLLVGLGASLEAADNDGYTPLMFATQSQRHDTIRLLVELGASLEAVDKEGTTPLIFATLNDWHDTIRLLVGLGASVEAADKKGLTPFKIASLNQRHDTMRLLVGLGASVEAAFDDGFTLLMIATLNEQHDTVRVLVELGASIDSPCKRGETALHYAAFTGQETMVRLLVDQGASIDVRDGEGKTPIECVREKDNEAIVQLLTR
ncbi:unnamed protein product [Clonostachys byssicola]|uniref:Vegetative incompatibility protein HET-E-1 n=1 Tax=Clonostachys byssicola TaxID=160290 RepID=A0A9N9UKV3_9HYPO|nr:unnamed protein product [Clonostachys byssicola]